MPFALYAQYPQSQGNKSFVAFSNLGDAESLTKTWKRQVCTKVASFLEQGSRLENLSWRLWHVQSIMVDSDNAKSKREFKKLSKCMGDKLDKEKGRSIEELEAPDYKANHSTDIIRQRAEEKERNRAMPGTIKRMQFTFNLDNPSPAVNEPVTKPNFKPSAEFSATSRTYNLPRALEDDMDIIVDDAKDDNDNEDGSSANSRRFSALRFPSLFNNDFGPSALLHATPSVTTSMNYGEGLNPTASHDAFGILRPTIELPLDELLQSVDSTTSYEPWSLVYPEPTAPQHQDVVMQPATPIYVPAPPPPTATIVPAATVIPPSASLITTTTTRKAATRPLAQESEDESSPESDDEDSEFDFNAPSRPAAKSTRKRAHQPLAQSLKEKDTTLQTVAPSKVNQLYATDNRSNATTSTGRPALTVRTAVTRSSGPSATATSATTALKSSLTNSGPGGQKAECSNCGATHTPLWRRGLNDELNCNACGLYCKLHKRPRPKSMRNTHGERAQAPPRQETVDVMGSSSSTPKVPPRSSSPVHRIAQCYNCHTTATPLWRKDDEGKTVCNACGLYYKLHGSARPISMKSDVIRKRSRHDARRGSTSGGNGLASVSDTPSASPGVSRRASPARETSPTLAPDSTTQMSYDYSEEMDYRSTHTHSELLGALGGDLSAQNVNAMFQYNMFPGPYHPDYMTQVYTAPGDGLGFVGSETAGPVEQHNTKSASTGSSNSSSANSSSGAREDPSMSPRTSKRRRMSTDSASEPPSSASYSSYNDGGGYATSSSATSLSNHSHSHSVEFPFSSSTTTSSSSFFNSAGPALRGSGNTFWHPPMMPLASESLASNISNLASTLAGVGSPHIIHPPMLPPTTEESPMDFLHHQPMHATDEELFSTFLHPPMAIPVSDNDFTQVLRDVHPPMLVDYHHDAFEGMRVY
ncbi:hypothetical protein H0H93_003012 [Arthromyces matolae]|nr:hypothetical protein H0H93_003012 [Arthromyces matolae]